MTAIDFAIILFVLYFIFNFWVASKKAKAKAEMENELRSFEKMKQQHLEAKRVDDGKRFVVVDVGGDDQVGDGDGGDFEEGISDRIDNDNDGIKNKGRWR